MESITFVTSMSIYRNIEIEAVDLSKHRDREESISIRTRRDPVDDRTRHSTELG
jgi:hypothetical protein